MGFPLHNYDGAFIVLFTYPIPVCNLLLPLPIGNGPQMLPFVFLKYWKLLLCGRTRRCRNEWSQHSYPYSPVEREKNLANIYDDENDCRSRVCISHRVTYSPCNFQECLLCLPKKKKKRYVSFLRARIIYFNYFKY